MRHQWRYLNRGRSGFSLLELLTVLIIVGVLAATVVLTYTSGSETRTLRTHAERFMLTVELARQKSTITNEIWGVKLNSSSYEFLRLLEDGEWYIVDETPFQHRSLGNDYWIQGRLIGKAQNQGLGSSDGVKPDFVIYPSGEMSPFEVSFTHQVSRAERFVFSDGLQRVAVNDERYRPLAKDDES